MADTKVQLESIRDDDLHGEHLCYIVSQGLNLMDEAGYRALIENPRYRCDHCGRTARSRQNLCVPLELHP
jgi:hypothetical protein